MDARTCCGKNIRKNSTELAWIITIEEAGL
jgi:hypothetical protein